MKYKDTIPSIDNELYRDLNARMQSICGTEITVDNIDSYADVVIDELISVVATCVDNYSIHNDVQDIKARDLEDKACEFYNLGSIGDVLTRAQHKYDTIERVNTLLRERVMTADSVIIPADVGSQIIPSQGKESRIELVRENRVKALLYILAEQGVDLSLITITDGIMLSHREMVRQTSYFTVEIPELYRTVQVCDERGNATYIFDMERMQQLGILTEDLNNSTKSQKNEMLKIVDGLGVRIAHGPDWINRMRSLLNDRIPTEAEEHDKLTAEQKVLIPHAIKGELHEWNGFYEDTVSGQHMGPISAIVEKSGLSRFIVNQRIADLQLSSTMIYSNTRLVAAYCYEEFISDPFVQEFLAQPETDKDGDWKGFYYDPELGEHFGTIAPLAERLSISSGLMSKIIASYELNGMPVRTQSGKTLAAYSIEEILRKTDIADYLSRPRVATEGEWAGYYTDNGGYHWGAGQVLRRDFNISAGTLRRVIEESSLTGLPVVAGKQSVTAYRYEDLVDNLHVQNLQNANRVEIEGENKGFYIDDEGRRWGTPERLANELHMSRKQLKRIVDFDVLDSVSLRTNVSATKANRVYPGYRFDEVERMVVNSGYLKLNKTSER